MKTKIAINGFGRIGRNAFKVAFERSDLEIIAINDLTDTKTLAHLLKYDSNYGTYQRKVEYDEKNLIVDGKHIQVLGEKEPSNLPWRDLDIDVVIESTGFFTKHEQLKMHLDAGAKKVILSAPEKDDTDHDTYVIGANEQDLKPDHQVISNASCTTNCITPVMAIIESNFGIEKAMMTTVHSYTASQKLQDAPAKDLREARAAAENIVPTTTGASIAAAKALPALDGIFGGLSIRVPTPVVSLSDFVIITKRDVTVEEVNEAFKKAAADPYYQGIVDVSEDELVSSDFIGNSHSAIVDLSLTAVVGGNLLKVLAWYDNEWGYSNRLVELTADAGKLLHSQGEKASTPETVEGHHETQHQTDPSAPPVLPVGEHSPAAEPMLEPPASAHEELLSPPHVSQPSNHENSPVQTSGFQDSFTNQPDPPSSSMPGAMPAEGNGSVDGIRRF
jgi:glyceraldehyde 3-phosphate dehydrogenase